LAKKSRHVLAAGMVCILGYIGIDHYVSHLISSRHSEVRKSTMFYGKNDKDRINISHIISDEFSLLEKINYLISIGRIESNFTRNLDRFINSLEKDSQLADLLTVLSNREQEYYGGVEFDSGNFRILQGNDVLGSNNSFAGLKVYPKNSDVSFEDDRQESIITGPRVSIKRENHELYFYAMSNGLLRRTFSVRAK